MRTKGYLLAGLLGAALGASAVLLLRPGGAATTGIAHPSEADRLLDEPIAELKLESVPLEEAIETLRRQTGANILVNWDALAKANTDRRTPVTVHGRGVTLAQALSVVIRTPNPYRPYTGLGSQQYPLPKPVGFTVTGGTILVSSEADAAEHGFCRAYDVRDLIDAIATGGAERPILHAGYYDNSGKRVPKTREQWVQAFMEFVMHVVGDRSWAEGYWRGPATIDYFDGRLVIRQSWENHRHLEGLFRTLRAAWVKSAPTASDPVPSPWGRWDVVEWDDQRSRWVPALPPPSTQPAILGREVAELRLEEVPLRDAVQRLREAYDVDIVVPWARLTTTYGLDGKKPVTLFMQDVTLASALDYLVRVEMVDGDLGYKVQGGTVLIAPKEEVTSPRVLRLYDVRDLPTAARLALAESVRKRDWREAEGEYTEQMANALTKIVAPESWISNGGSGEISVWNGRLIITHTPEVHAKVETFFDFLRSADGPTTSAAPR